MENPVKDLDPSKKISWTLWNLDSDSKITSWYAIMDDKSPDELISEIGGAWITVSADADALDSSHSDSTIHGIVAEFYSPPRYILFVPNVRGAFVEV